MSNGIDWEARYQHGDTPWDKGEAHPALLDFLREQPLDGKILVPGCGYGYDVRAIAHEDNSVLGIDVAESAIRRANQFPKSAHEQYRLADLFRLPSELRNNFDWAFEHTCFCAIDPMMRAAYVEAMAAALKPGGQLLAIFYLDPRNEDSGWPVLIGTTEHRQSKAEPQILCSCPQSVIRFGRDR